MARGHGRILTSIWEDADFLALAQPEQRMYLFLISQPNLNHAGLLPLTLRRWARKAHGLTVAEVEKSLAMLETGRFTVMDEDTEELLIRTFVRNDGVWRMPNVMGAMVSDAQEISSKKLRRALLGEMDRLPLDVLSDETPKRGGPSARVQVECHLANLRELLWDPEPTPPPNPFGRVRETLPGTLPEGSESGDSEPGGDSTDARNGASAECEQGAEEEPQVSDLSDEPEKGSGNPSGTLYAHTRAFSPSPSPTTNPIPKGRAVAEAAEASAVELAPVRPDGRPAPIDDDDFQLSDAMRRWAIQTFGNALDIDYETAQFIDHHRAEGRRRKNWSAEWQKWMRRSAKWASERSQRALPAAAGAENVIHLPTGQLLPGTDTRVHGWLSLPTEE